MFVIFFEELKSAGVPVTLREYLTLMQAMALDLADRGVEDFYYSSARRWRRTNLDKFDRVFGISSRALDLLRSVWSGQSTPPHAHRPPL